MTFLFNLESLLDTVNDLDKNDMETAVNMLKDKMWSCKLRHNGPCLQCRKHNIDYVMSTAHKICKDKWLKKLFKSWDKSIKIGIFEYRHNTVVKLNGAPDSVLGYCCKDCREWIQQHVNELKQKHKMKLDELQIQEDEKRKLLPLQIKQVISGEIKSTISNRYWTLCRYVTQKKSLKLAAMSYEKFLKTSYWDIIRKYKLYKSKFKCSLCDKDGMLHVHHKTYEHHGEEHNNLDDLIVLCKACHEKFHDIKTSN
jgi:hypothetical protein